MESESVKRLLTKHSHSKKIGLSENIKKRRTNAYVHLSKKLESSLDFFDASDIEGSAIDVLLSIDPLPGYPSVHLAAGAIYYACREEGVPVLFNEIKKEVPFGQGFVSPRKLLGLFPRIVGRSYPDPCPVREFVKRFAPSLVIGKFTGASVPREAVSDGLLLSDRIEMRVESFKATNKVLAGCALYLIANLHPSCKELQKEEREKASQVLQSYFYDFNSVPRKDVSKALSQKREGSYWEGVSMKDVAEACSIARTPMVKLLPILRDKLDSNDFPFEPTSPPPKRRGALDSFVDGLK